MFGPEFWVGVAFVLFAGLLVWKKVPAMINSALDKRADAIRAELDQARRLKEEAQALLADYQRRQNEAVREAEDIVSQARREAEAIGKESRKALQETLARRTRLAKDKIGRAEEQAISDVRTRSVEVAIGAAERLIGSKMSGGAASGLIDAGLKDLKSKLNG